MGPWNGPRQYKPGSLDQTFFAGSFISLLSGIQVDVQHCKKSHFNVTINIAHSVAHKDNSSHFQASPLCSGGGWWWETLRSHVQNERFQHRIRWCIKELIQISHQKPEWISISITNTLFNSNLLHFPSVVTFEFLGFPCYARVLSVRLTNCSHLLFISHKIPPRATAGRNDLVVMEDRCWITST